MTFADGGFGGDYASGSYGYGGYGNGYDDSWEGGSPAASENYV